MNFSEVISNRLTEVITNDLDFPEEKKEIIAYAIETVLLFILGLLLIMFFGYAFNTFMPVVIAAIFGGSLRRVSGGAHFNTPLKCLAFGTIIYTLIGVLAKNLVNYNFNNKYIFILILILSFLLVYFLAPVDSEAKPIHSRSLKLKLRICSIVLIIVTLLITFFVDNELFNLSAVLGVFYQCITLLPIFNRKGGEYK